MPKQIAKPHGRAMMDIVEQYRASGQKLPATKQEIACWAIENELWEPQPQHLIKQCANELASAMKEATYTDPQGRQVRVMANARMTILDEDGKRVQQHLWDDVRLASSEHVAAAFTQQHDQIGADCYSLYRSVCSANDNNPNLAGNPVQFSWDFSEYVNAREVEEVDSEGLPNKPR